MSLLLDALKKAAEQKAEKARATAISRVLAALPATPLTRTAIRPVRGRLSTTTPVGVRLTAPISTRSKPSSAFARC